MARINYMLWYEITTGQVTRFGPPVDRTLPTGVASIPCVMHLHPGPDWQTLGVLSGHDTLGVFSGHDVWTGTVADIEAWLATTPQPWEIAAVLECERTNKNRTGAIGALEGRL